MSIGHIHSQRDLTPPPPKKKWKWETKKEILVKTHLLAPWCFKFVVPGRVPKPPDNFPLFGGLLPQAHAPGSLQLVQQLFASCTFHGFSCLGIHIFWQEARILCLSPPHCDSPPWHSDSSSSRWLVRGHQREGTNVPRGPSRPAPNSCLSWRGPFHCKDCLLRMLVQHADQI